MRERITEACTSAVLIICLCAWAVEIECSRMHVAEPLLIRCSWGDNFGREGVSARCSDGICRSSQSIHAYGDFMANEAMMVGRKNYQLKLDGENSTSLRQAFTYSTAQCLFYDDTDIELHYEDIPTDPPLFKSVCSCVYPALEDFCLVKKFIRIDYKGDSTMLRLKQDLSVACAQVMGGLLKPEGNEEPKATMVIRNEGSLHYLYLPHAREVDRSMKDEHGGKGNLKEAVGTLQHYLASVEEMLGNATESHPDRDSTIYLYMESNQVCPMVYDADYFRSWRSMTDQIDVQEIGHAAIRRNSNLDVALSMTLDNYGSTFSSKLAVKHVLPKFPHFLLLPNMAKYPGSCMLTDARDGRHFSRYQYRLAKGRLLWYLIEPKYNEIVRK